ncbi:MAG TPA: hypothetical protein VE982_00090 [Gaiellaceae bacterium]|nr:hypothetical protein [Gaiellaceae bacterium]
MPMRKLVVSILAALAVVPQAAAGIDPVPSLTPAATHALWLREVARARAHPRAVADATCRPARVIFYAQTDWLRLATKLAQTASPCAQYYVSIPPLTSDKTQPRPGQAALIRALGPNFHAVDEINYTAWSRWVASGAGTFTDAGVLARQRMAAAGFDTAAGDTWAMNELSSAVRAGTGNARANALALLQGLASDGVRGITFAAGVAQSIPDASTYKVNVQNWLQDASFWGAIANDVSDFAYENYGDVRNYAVAGSTPQQRRDAMVQYLGHIETLADAAPPPAAAAAQPFLRQAYVAFGNAAWSWQSAYGFTAVPLQNMEDFVAGQAYASRSFAAATGEAVDRFGYAWAPVNVPVSESGALLDVLAAAIRDSGVPTPDPGVLACGTSLCTTSVPGAAFTSVWQQFSTWTQSTIAFATPPVTITAGTVSPALTVQVQTGGVPDVAKADTPVTLTSSSPGGGLSTSATGPFSPSLTVTIPAGTSSVSFYYTDTRAGTPELSATVPGQPSVVQLETVTPAAPVALAVTPPKATLKTGARQQFAVAGTDAYGNAVPVTATWSASAGTITPTGLFIAPQQPGAVTVTAAVGTLTGTAAVAVTQPAPRIVSARTTRVAGHVVATVLVRPAKRVAVNVRVRRGSSVVAVVRGWTTHKGTFTWRSKKKLPPGRYVVRATLRSASTA